jgi:hypothetical protein
MSALKLSQRIASSAIAACCILSLSLPAAYGESTFKDLIFRDCPKTLELLETTAADEKEKLVPFLREVLKLKIAAMQDPAAALGPKGAAVPGLESDLGNIWRSFSPDREIEAKRCALKALRTLGSSAGPALPEILELAGDPTLGDDFVDLIDGTLFGIAPLLYTTASQGQVNELAAVALKHLSDLGDVTLATLPEQLAVRAVFVEGPKLPIEPLDEIAEFLRWLDPQSVYSQNVAFEILEKSPSPEQRIFITRALGRLYCPNTRTARHLRDLTLSTDPITASDARAALQNIVRTVLAEPGCPATSSAISGTELLYLLFEDLRQPDLIPAEQLLNRISDRLELALPLIPGRSVGRILPFLRIALESPAAEDGDLASIGTKVLLALGNQALEFIQDILNGKVESARRRAARALHELHEDDSKKLRTFIPFLLDRDKFVRSEVYAALAPVAKDLRREIQKLASSSSGAPPDYALLALAKSGAPSSATDAAITKLPAQMACGALKLLASAFPNPSPKLASALISRGRECLAESAEQACHALSWITLIPSVEKELLDDVSAHFDAGNAECILGAFPSAALREKLSLTSSNLFPLLQDQREQIFSQALDTLRPLAKTDASIASEFESIVLSSESSNEHRCRTFRALGAAARDENYWRDFGKKLLNSDIALNFVCIGCIQTPGLAQFLRERLDGAAQPDKAAITRILGYLGGKALPAEAVFNELSGSKTLELRYQATVALLRSSSQPRTLLPHVDALLGSRKARPLSLEPLPEQALISLRSGLKSDAPVHARAVYEFAAQRSAASDMCFSD